MAESLPEGYEWWKIIIMAHIVTIPPTDGTLGQKRALCGRSFYASEGPSSFKLGSDPAFYPRCRLCLRSLAKRKREDTP